MPLCLYCALLVCEIRWLMPPALLFLLKFALALWGLLSLYMDFRIFFFISIKSGILIQVTLKKLSSGDLLYNSVAIVSNNILYTQCLFTG